jgi:hypothetical protein
MSEADSGMLPSSLGTGRHPVGLPCLVILCTHTLIKELTMTEYKRYNNLKELTAGMADYVNDCLTNAHGYIGDIEIKVESVPSADEWYALTSDEARLDAWDNAVGCYGIKAVGREFDSDSTILVGAYYGTCNLLASKQFDFDTSDEDVGDIVRGLLVDLLICGDDLQRSYLVRIKETDEVPDSMLL